MTEPKPFVFNNNGEAKRHAPATLRNRDAIAAVLRQILPESGNILEIASGTGEHVLHFAEIFPDLHWRPSDMDPAALRSISAWAQEADLPNIGAPVMLDVLSEWPSITADAILCINMLHISPPAATNALFKGASMLLSSGAPLYIYGPFIQDGVETADSNLAFDHSLKQRNGGWGLRDVENVVAIAKEHGFALSQNVEMPANNRSLIFISG